MDSTRQQKIARQLQKDLSEIFIREAAELFRGLMLSVTAVRVSPDLSSAKVYLSVFPFEKHEQAMALLEQHGRFIRRALGDRIRNQMRIVPELSFFLDDSLEYIRNIDNLLKED